MSISMLDVKPYGFMAEPFEDALCEGKPGAWNDAEEYEPWVKKMVGKISDAIWPEWDQDSRCWKGAAQGSALSLTAADLDLMARLADRFALPPRGDEVPQTNEWWFIREDVLFGQTVTDYPYGCTLEDRFALCFPKCGVPFPDLRHAFNGGGLGTYNASLSWQLKSHLQRPRAGHLAKLLGLPAPAVKMASSAWSPSAISGHSFQGMMAALRIYTTYHDVMTDGEEKALKKLAVDMGDRRVLAGVHFPSDNLMSWWTALEVLPFIKKNDAEEERMHAFVTGAIRESEIYQRMKANAGHHAAIRVLDPWFPP